jgi:hypothetical protein
MGLRLEWLGTKRLWWNDLRAIIRHSPADSALVREQLGEAASYGANEHLLGLVVHMLRVLDWRLMFDPKAKPPERVLLPGETPEKTTDDLRRGDAMTIEELHKRLNWDPPGTVKTWQKEEHSSPPAG